MYGGLNLKHGLSLRPYGGEAATPTDPFFAFVTVLYGFEDANFASGVHNDGSLGDGVVTSGGVAPNSTFFVAGHQSAAFNQNGPLSNDGILTGSTGSVIGSGDFTIEGWVRDPGSATTVLLSCGVTDVTTNRINLAFLNTKAVSMVFDNATTVNSANDVWPPDEFFHYAFVYVSATTAWRVYINGTQVVSGTNSFGRAGNAYLGQHNNIPQPVNGPQYLDELRITMVARYSGSSFPVPSAPFPRS